MKITFLGTGGSFGVPMIGCNCIVCTSRNSKDQRLRSSICIEIKNQNCIIDITPDFRYQILRENIQRVDAVLLTHEHEDHTGGIDDLRAFSIQQKKSIPIYTSQEVKQHLEKKYQHLLMKTYQKQTIIPKINIHNITHKLFIIKELNQICTPVRLQHKYISVLGFRIKNFTYLTDFNSIEESEYNKLKKTKILVLDCLQKDPHDAHLHLELAIQIAQKVKAKLTYFTHISHHLGLHEEINKNLPDNIYLAFDGLQIEA